MRRRSIGGSFVLTAFIFQMVLVVTILSAWITHIVHCISTQEWFLLIAGAIAAPVGIVHGIGLWFGWWG